MTAVGEPNILGKGLRTVQAGEGVILPPLSPWIVDQGDRGHRSLLECSSGSETLASGSHVTGPQALWRCQDGFPAGFMAISIELKLLVIQ